MAIESCGRDWLLHSHSPSKVQRIEAYFGGHGYEPHRHDTYAIGRTLAGVQSFRYRRAIRHSLPGGTLVLHPDELHDGMAGTEAGFHYRMLYIDPLLIQQVLAGKPLPFIAGGLSDDIRLRRTTESFMQAMDYSFESLEEDDAIRTKVECRPPHDKGRRDHSYRGCLNRPIIAGFGFVAVVGPPCGLSCSHLTSTLASARLAEAVRLHDCHDGTHGSCQPPYSPARPSAEAGPHEPGV